MSNQLTEKRIVESGVYKGVNWSQDLSGMQFLVIMSGGLCKCMAMKFDIKRCFKIYFIFFNT